MSLYSRKSARRSLFDTVMYRGVSQVVTMLSYIVIVRGMSEHEFGVLSLLYAFIPVVSMLASFGLEQTLRRFQPEYLRSGNKSAAAWLVRVVASARFGTNVVVLAIVLLTWNLQRPFQAHGISRGFRLVLSTDIASLSVSHSAVNACLAHVASL